jgi:adenosylcobinamide amidohydrolase
VFRLIDGDGVMTVPAGSFRNELVRLAGGIPMEPPGQGQTVTVSREQWKAFDPQFVLGCGSRGTAWKAKLQAPGWREAEAVRTGALVSFPCSLACRPSDSTGRAVLWLLSLLHPESFSGRSFQIQGDRLLEKRPVPIDLPLVRESAVIHSGIADARHKTLGVFFREPQEILSTLEGYRTGIKVVGNHFIPPPCWGLLHDPGMAAMKSRILETLGWEAGHAGFLVTGADMDNLAVSRRRFRDLEVVAAVTAGVRSNAQRMSRSQGGYYEPGTINILLMTSMALSPRAMARAVITATEAKSAALQDLDIRATDSPMDLGATGTGTDNILVVRGQGPLLDNAGGHAKLGELIAAAVHDGVTRAVLLQNGIARERDIFQRLEERGLSLNTLAGQPDCERVKPQDGPAAALEAALMTPEVSGLLEAALGLSDAASRGLSPDLAWFDAACRGQAEALAGKPLDRPPQGRFPDLPEPLAAALDWILAGASEKKR